MNIDLDGLTAFFKSRREELGLSKSQIAQESGLHPTGVGKMEQYHRDMRLNTFVALCKAHSVDPIEVFKSFLR
jgi:hypothetical protein